MTVDRRNTSNFYRPELDLLRLLAFVMVYIHHTFSGHRLPVFLTFNKCCAAGVQLFFVLSSYLITELLLRESESTGTIHITAFFKRRILRIWPLYFCFIFVYMTVTWLTHARTPTIAAFLSLLLLSGNWYTAFYGFLPPIISPLWSISIEEQYYLLWPFIALSAKRGLWLISLVAFAGAYLALFYLGTPLHPYTAVWANSFVEFQFFAVGATLALVLHKKNFAPSLWLRFALLLCALASIACAQAVFHFTNDLLPFSSLAPAYLLLAVGVTTLFLAIYKLSIPNSFRPLLYLGKISYGLYVFHMAAVFLTAWLIGLASSRLHLRSLGSTLALLLTIGFASLSYYLLEMPFLRLRRRFMYINTRAD